MIQKYKTYRVIFADFILLFLYSYLSIAIVFFADANLGKSMSTQFYIGVSVVAFTILLYLIFKIHYCVKNFRLAKSLYNKKNIKLLKALMIKTKKKIIITYLLNIFINFVLISVIDIFLGILGEYMPIWLIIVIDLFFVYITILSTSAFAYSYLILKYNRNQISKFTLIFHIILQSLYITDFIDIFYLEKKFRKRR